MMNGKCSFMRKSVLLCCLIGLMTCEEVTAQDRLAENGVLRRNELLASQAAPYLLPGTYRCSAYNVSGGGGSCRNVPPLVLVADGSYQFSSSRGRWSIYGGKLLLSEAQIWGQGEILGSNTVRFEYDYRGWRHTVIWVCQECASASQGTVNPSNGPFVGVSLTLQFSQQVGGVSGFTIVPVESARNYAHNAPLPNGAVQGLAWEAGPTSVGVATNRNNKLMSGRRYVIFLAWPRESIPVAIMEIPPMDRDYTATLPATLDGASILAQLDGGSVSIPPPGQFPSEAQQALPPGTYTQPPPVPSEPPQGYPPPTPVTQGGMAEGGMPAAPNGSAPSPQTGSEGRSGLQELMNTVNDLGKAFEGLTRRGKKERKPDESGGASPSNQSAYPPAQPAYPGPDPSTSYQPTPSAYPGPDPSSNPSAPPAGYPGTGYSDSNPSGYPASPPPTYDSGGTVPSYGGAQGGQAATPPPLPPKCNPLIPKYSQPGCVE